MQSRMARGIALIGTIAALGACGGGGDGGGGSNPVTTIAMAAPSGNAQTDTIGAPLANQIRVVVSEDGAVSDGATVNWSAFTGGGQVAPATSVTGLDGVATTTWTLGNTLGAQSARATVTGAGGSPVTFTATAGPGNPNQISSNAGDNQSALLNVGFATPISVKVGDRLNNGVNGVTVNWVVLGGGPGLAVDGPTSGTNPQGIASMTATAGGTGGIGTIQATTGGVGGQAAFNLTVIAATRQVNVGPGQTFRSVRNNTQNPSVDTVQAGEAVYWLNGGSIHTVLSTGAPSFTSSGNLQGVGASYLLTFANPGTYQYECALHGSNMTGTIVVQ